MQNVIKILTDNTNNAFDAELELLTLNKDRKLYFINKMEEKLDVIVESFKAWGLTVTDIVMSKTGNHTAPWKDCESVRLSIKNVPFNNKIRFIKERPYEYTSSGASVNRKKLDAKADKMREALKEATGLGVSVNPYSLETPDGKPASILIDMWIKE